VVLALTFDAGRDDGQTARVMNGRLKMSALSLVCVWLAASAIAADYVEPKVTINHPEFNGSSGLVAAPFSPGVFYSHNDGTDNRVFAFDKKGRQRGVWRLEDVKMHDVEEMAWLAVERSYWLMLADTGDNRTPKRNPPDVFHLHFVPLPKPVEPDGAGTKDVQTIPSRLIRTIPFRYEGGPVDCEAAAVAVGEKGNEVLLINKVPRDRAGDGILTTNVYALTIGSEIRTGRRHVARRILKGMPPLPEQITGMDMAPDGKRLVIQTYDDAYEFDFEKDWVTTLAKPHSRKIPVRVEPTGHPKDYTFREAICYASGALTISPAGLPEHSEEIYITRELSSWEIENTKRRTPLWRIR